MHGCFWSVTLTALALLCIPGGLPRYILPLYVPASIAVVSLYFRVDESPRLAYERFAYFALLIMAVLLFLVLATGTVVSMNKGLAPMWPAVFASVIMLVGYVAWLVKMKTQPGVFISTPIAMAIAYFFISSVTIPFEREEYQFREGAKAIGKLAEGIPGKRVFYADSDFRNVHPKHLRLLYYLGDDFIDQGESKQLPAGTEFLIGREDSLPAMTQLAGKSSVQRSVDLTVDGLPLKALYLAPLAE